jgi:hypothetical protein
LFIYRFFFRSKEKAIDLLIKRGLFPRGHVVIIAIASIADIKGRKRMKGPKE